MIIKIKFSAQLPATKSYIRFPITDSQENKDANVNFFLNLYVPYISNKHPDGAHLLFCPF